MKYLNLFISIIIFATTVYCKIDDCPEVCNIVKQCISELDIKGTYTVYPPKDELGKCFCGDVQQYFNCLDCSQKKEGKKTYVIGTVTGSCNRVLGLVGTSGSAGIGNTGTSGTTPGTTPGNPADKTAGNTIGNDANNAAGNTASNTAGTGTNGANNNGNSNSNSNTNSKNNSTSSDSKEKENKSGGGSKIGIIVIAIVAAVAVGGFFVYTRKQKERPESMPFFGNSAASPNHYATLGNTKEMNDLSTNNLTSDYNSQFYPNVDSSSNQYNLNNSNSYNNPYEAPQHSFNNQYDQNYQDYNNQYGNYENDVAPVSTLAGTTTNQANANDSAHYESRRESMIPGTQPTANTFTGAYVCAYKYDPQLDDELELQVNDQVQIIEEYEDGWMKAINLTTGKEGMAPRVCIKEAN